MMNHHTPIEKATQRKFIALTEPRALKTVRDQGSIVISDDR